MLGCLLGGSAQSFVPCGRISFDVQNPAQDDGPQDTQLRLPRVSPRSRHSIAQKVQPSTQPVMSVSPLLPIVQPLLKKAVLLVSPRSHRSIVQTAQQSTKPAMPVSPLLTIVPPPSKKAASLVSHQWTLPPTTKRLTMKAASLVLPPSRHSTVI